MRISPTQISSSVPSVAEATPTNTTFVSVVTPAGWSATTPAVGATGTITFTRATFAAGGTANFTVVVNVDPLDKAALIDPILAKFQQVFAACAPAIDFASKTNSAEGTIKAAGRLDPAEPV